MESLNNKNFIEVKDERFFIQATEQLFLKKRTEPIALGTQYQVIK